MGTHESQEASDFHPDLHVRKHTLRMYVRTYAHNDLFTRGPSKRRKVEYRLPQKGVTPNRLADTLVSSLYHLGLADTLFSSLYLLGLFSCCTTAH